MVCPLGGVHPPGSAPVFELSHDTEQRSETTPWTPRATSIVVGAGPTGLMLASELALAGLRCRLLERRADQPNITRAFAVHARTLELLDARGMADELVPRGIPVREVQPAPGAAVDLRDLDSRFPMILIAPQSGTEHVLEQRARALGSGDRAGRRGSRPAPGRRHASSSTSPTAPASQPHTWWVATARTARSASLVGIDFVGRQYETHIMLADVRLAEPPGGGHVRGHRNGGGGDRGAVRRRLVPGHRLGPAAGTGAAGRAAAHGGDAGGRSSASPAPISG